MKQALSECLHPRTRLLSSYALALAGNYSQVVAERTWAVSYFTPHFRWGWALLGALSFLTTSKEFQPKRIKIRADSFSCVEVKAPNFGRPRIAGKRSLWRVAIAASSSVVSRKGERWKRPLGAKDAAEDVELACVLRARRRLSPRFPALDFLRGFDRLLATADLPSEGDRLSCSIRLVRFDGF